MNTFGHSFRLSIFGESHGPAVGIIIDGLPAGLPLSEEDLLNDLQRRAPLKAGTTSRQEKDFPQFKSGLKEGKTTGAPLLIVFANQDIQSYDYERFRYLPRPSHADFSAHHRFGGFNDYRGGGHFSGRITVGLVAAGAIAKKLITPTKVKAWVSQVRGSSDIEAEIEAALQANDSVGGLIECRASPVPVGLGDPFFDSVESLISHLVFSIPAVKGIEFGSGFKLAQMRGSEANDIIINRQGQTATNHNGGVTGGLTNGNELVLRVAIKPTPSILQPQKTIDFRTGEKSTLVIEGRHDTCVALRAAVIVEAAVALVLADLMLRVQKIPLIWREPDE